MKKFAQGLMLGLILFMTLCFGLAKGSESADKQWRRCYQAGIEFERCYQAIR